jgi:Flp pilus assembly protein TadD
MAAARKAGSETAPPASIWKRDFVICLLLMSATFALYGRAIGYPFIEHYDDESYITGNSHVQAGLTRQTIAWALTSTEQSNWHPLTWLSHALDCEIYGLNPSGHHFTNILLHAINVMLLFLLLRRATGATGRSALVAALFAVHPYNVESVAWIAERKNVLSMLFFLLTLGAYGWYALKPSLRRYALVATLFALGLAAKPMVITLPCVLLLLDYWPLRRIEGWGPRDRGDESLAIPQVRFSRLVLEKLPLLALSAGSAVITMIAQRTAMHLVLPVGIRLENAVYAYAMYVWKAFWPVRLAVFYPHPGATLAGWQVGLAALFVIAISTVVWHERSSRPYLVTGWLWYLGTLVPVIGLIQVGEQGMADRYAYLPLIGIFVMGVWSADELAERRHTAIGMRVKISGIVLAVLAAFTWEQVPYWRSSYDLWSNAVNVTKDNFTADLNLGVALITSDRASEAVPHLQDAARIKPGDASIHLTLAGALQLSDHPREAIPEYLTAIQLEPGSSMPARVYEDLGKAYERTGNYKDALVAYNRALSIDPQQESTQRALASLHLSEAMRNAAESPSGGNFFLLGQLLQKAGRIVPARAAYEQALELDPKLQDARKALESLGNQ